MKTTSLKALAPRKLVITGRDSGQDILIDHFIITQCRVLTLVGSPLVDDCASKPENLQISVVSSAYL